MKNVLLTSVGRRVELAQAFAEEIKKRAPLCCLFATEIHPEISPACQVVDNAFKAPSVTSENYIPYLFELCKKKNIGMVVPTIDTELVLLAQHRESFLKEGIELIVSDEALVAECRDKRKTQHLFRRIGLSTPRIFLPDALEFPCFAKPFDGSCSVGAIFFENRDMVTEEVKSNPRMMFMEFVDSSYQEYTVDVYYDQYGVLRCFVPRLRLETRAGEVSKGVTRRNYVYDYLKDKLPKIQGARGCITLQLFANPSSESFAALEINPRFGGGFPLSYAAGANYIGWLLDEYLLRQPIPSFEEWEPNLLMLRYDAKVLVHGY